jgi:putative acetyltransferase
MVTDWNRTPNVRVGERVNAVDCRQSMTAHTASHSPAFKIRSAQPADADRIASAHRESISSLGPRYYEPDIVQDWGAHIRPEMYATAMAEGEQFFVAVDAHAIEYEILGFSSTRSYGGEHHIAVYVRGSAARRGVGSALFREAERAARANGAASIHVDASLAAVEFYRAQGFDTLGHGEHRLPSGRKMPCVFMQKRFEPLDNA